MTTIVEIMRAIEDYSEVSHALGFEGGSKWQKLCAAAPSHIRDLITAALADAERRGAEAMRWAAGDAAQTTASKGLSASAVHLCIRALPLPLGSQPAEVKPGEWIEWAGGECPIGISRCHVRFRDGDEWKVDFASDLEWMHQSGGGGGDIIAYRVLP